MTTDPLTAEEKASIEARAEDASRNGADPAGDDGEEQEQLFVLESEKRISLSQLYKRGTPVEFEINLTSKSFKGQGMQLVSFDDPDILLVVDARAGKVETDPTYNPDGSVKKVKIRANLKPRVAYDARSEAGRVALTGE